MLTNAIFSRYHIDYKSKFDTKFLFFMEKKTELLIITRVNL